MSLSLPPPPPPDISPHIERNGLVKGHSALLGQVQVWGAGWDAAEIVWGNLPIGGHGD